MQDGSRQTGWFLRPKISYGFGGEGGGGGGGRGGGVTVTYTILMHAQWTLFIL